MALWLSRIGRFSARRAWIVVTVWVALLVLAAVGASTFAKPLTHSYSISGLRSLSTLSTVDRNFGRNANGGDIVFAAPNGETFTAADAVAVRKLAARVAGVQGVTSAPDPFAADTASISPDKRVGYLSVGLSKKTPSSTTSDQVDAAIRSARSGDHHLDIAVGSDLVPVPDSSSNEGIALLIGFVVLLITFGSLVAAGLPLLMAVTGLGISLEGIHLATSIVSLNSISTVLATLLGLAVGIDYSLFIVSRHRRQVREGLEVRESIAVANGTAGSAVFFAAIIVIIALAGLSIIRIGFLTQMGLCGAAAVLVALLVSLTLTPALLRFIGPRIVSTRARRRLSTGENRTTGRIASRWVALTSRHPIIFVLASVAGLVALAVPVTSMQVGLPNDGAYPASTSARQAFDLKADGFGPGINAPILVLAQYRHRATTSDVAGLAAHLGTITDVLVAVPSGRQGNTALITVLPKSGPSDVDTKTLVKRLRDVSAVTGISDAPSLQITGTTAVDIDISDQVSAAFPGYLALIAAFAFLLLMIVFRSILVPLKATIGFLLSLGATLGGVVAVFQWGWLGGLFHVTPGPLLSFLPVIVTGVLFGLSMDYEMFLISGMREQIAHGAEPRAGLHRGFIGGAAVIVAAGAIMISVFGSGAFDSADPTSQAIAFALTLGVLVDVFVVRMTLVPAVLALLGRSAWWFPRWLDRLLPTIDVEGLRLAPLPTVERTQHPETSNPAMETMKI